MDMYIDYIRQLQF